MPKGYWIVRVDVTDPDVYAQYMAAVASPLAEFGARFVVRGGRHEVAEGSTRARQIVLEFSSYETALACYRSPAYQQAARLRFASAETDLVIAEGAEL